MKTRLKVKTQEEYHETTLYVSKNGSDKTAKKGHPHFPYASPWGAIKDAVAGDTIHVLSGEWTVGKVGSGAEVELGVKDNLFKENVTYIFDSVTIRFIDNYSNALFLRDDSNATDTEYIFNIYGDARFIGFVNPDGSFKSKIIQLKPINTGVLSSINIEIKEVFNIAHCSYLMGNIKDVNVKIDNLYSDMSSNCFFRFGSFGSTAEYILSKNANIKLSIGNVRIGDTSRTNYSGNINNTILRVGGVIKSNIDVYVDNFTYFGAKVQGLLFSNDNRQSFSENNFNIKINNINAIEIRDEENVNYNTLSPTANLFSFSAFNPTHPLILKNKTNNITLEIGNYVGNIPVLSNCKVNQEYNTDDASKLNVRINSAYVDSNLFNIINSAGFDINFDCLHCISSKTSNLKAQQVELNLSGHYINRQDVLINITPNTGLTLRDCVLVSNGSDIITTTSTTPVDVKVMNTYTNNLTANSLINELIEPIKRESNVS